MSSKLKAVLFDFDGTVFSSEKEAQRIVKELFEESQGTEVDDDELKAYTGIPLTERFEHMLVMRGMDDPSLATELGEKAGKLYHSLPITNLLISGVQECMQSAKDAGLLVAIVSSSRHEHIEKKLTSVGLDHIPDLITGIDDVQTPKPHPQPYTQTLEALGCAPESAVVFEDSPTGIESARLAGIAVVGMLTFLHEHELLGVVDHIHDFTNMSVERMQSYVD